MGILCSLGMHKAVRPYRNRRVGSILVDTKLCLCCHRLKSMFDGWFKLTDEEFGKYFNEEDIVALEKSCAYNVLGYKLPFETQVRIVEGMGFDVSDEQAILDLTKEVTK